MSDFLIWFTTGIEHILNFNGADHILFIALLTLTFPIKRWKGLIILITAFTLGHSLSLALSCYRIIQLNQNFVEFLIAFSILITSIYHLANIKNVAKLKIKFMYFIVTVFGLIHGLGFSYLLKSMFETSESLILPLLSFNLGLEVGQLAVTLIVIIISFGSAFLFKVPFQLFKLINVVLIGLFSIYLCFVRFLEIIN